jgi:hypothetical protein
MPGITNGAELVKRLRESGTGADKLAVGVKLLEESGGKATAEQIADALGERFGEHHGTVVKARQLVATGELAPPPKQAEPPEAKFMKDDKKKG